MRAFDPLAFPGSDADCSSLDMAGRILAGPYSSHKRLGMAQNRTEPCRTRSDTSQELKRSVFAGLLHLRRGTAHLFAPLSIFIKMRSVEGFPRFSKTVYVFDDPGPKRNHSNQ